MDNMDMLMSLAGCDEFREDVFDDCDDDLDDAEWNDEGDEDEGI